MNDKRLFGRDLSEDQKSSLLGLYFIMPGRLERAKKWWKKMKQFWKII
jgi:hypothetical protein